MKRSAARVLVAVGLGLAALWLAYLRPTALGGSTQYVIVSGTSMEPTLYEGDLVVVRERARYEVGDVIAVRVPEGAAGPADVVIHRIVAGNETDGYITQGDNRRAHDEWRAMPDDILGTRLVRVPKLGALLSWLAQPFVLGFAIGAAAASLVWAYWTQARAAATTTAPAASTPATTDQAPLPTKPVTAPSPTTPGTLRPARAATSATGATSGSAHRHRPGASSRDAVADRIRHRYEHTTDPAVRLQIRQTVFELAATFASEDPAFDAAEFLRACGAHAYDVGAAPDRDHQR